MAPSSMKETCPVRAAPDRAKSAGGCDNAKPTVTIAVLTSHLPCMRMRFSLGAFPVIVIASRAGLGTSKRKDIRFAAPCAAAFLVIPAPQRRLFRAPDGVVSWNREGSNIQFL